MTQSANSHLALTIIYLISEKCVVKFMNQSHSESEIPFGIINFRFVLKFGAISYSLLAEFQDPSPQCIL